MRTTLLVLFLLLNTSLFSQNQNTKSKIIQTDNALSYSSISFKEMNSLRNYYDEQSLTTPQQLWQDPVNTNNIHAVSEYSSDISFNDRSVKYFFSSNGGVTWTIVSSVPAAGLQSTFGSITGLSNGCALIACNTSLGTGGNRTVVFADAFPGLGSFSTLDEGGGGENQYIWPVIMGTSNISLSNKFITMSSRIGVDSSYINIGRSLTSSDFRGFRGLDAAGLGYSIGRSNTGTIGIVYIKSFKNSVLRLGDLYFMESTDNGNTFSTATKIYDCDMAVDSMGAGFGTSIVYQGNSPKVVFCVIKYDINGSYYESKPSKIRFWSPSLPGADPTRSLIIADENNVPFTPGDYEPPIYFPAIGTSNDNGALFCTMTVKNSVIGSLSSRKYNDLYIARSTNGGSNWLTPERISPLTPRNDWSYASVSPNNDYTTDTYFANILVQKDTVPGFTSQGDFRTNAHPYFVKVGFSRASSPPNPPNLIAPANNSINIALMANFSWSASGLNYHLQVSTNSGFSNIIYEQNNIPFIQHQIPAGILSSSTVYYWRVAASNEFGEGSFSGAFTFTTTSQSIPVAPVLISPANGATNVIFRPQLDWADVSGAANYRVQLALSRGFVNTMVLDTGNLSSSFINIPFNLHSISTYYWKVCASNAAGTGVYSEIDSFTTQQLSSPILTSPLDSSFVPISLTVNWGTVQAADYYNLQISAFQDFHTWIYNENYTNPGVQINSLPIHTKWYWRVRANNSGNFGPFSSIWSFTTVISSPTLVSPTNGQNYVSSNPTFKWNTVGGRTGYSIIVSANTNFTDTIFSHDADTTFYTIPGGILQYNTYYYWKVRARDSVSYSSYSPPWNFKVRDGGTSDILPPGLVAPFNGQQGVLLNPTLKWNTVAGRTGYSFIVSTNTNFTDTIFSHNSDTTFYTIPLGILELNTVYYWKARSQDISGYGSFGSPWSFKVRTTGIQTVSEIIPTEYKLFTNYPNPFNPTTKIKFDLPKSSFVKINIFDVTGRMISELANTNLQAGSYETEFNGANLSSGIYYYRIEAGSFVETKKMILVK